MYLWWKYGALLLFSAGFIQTNTKRIDIVLIALGSSIRLHAAHQKAFQIGGKLAFSLFRSIKIAEWMS